MKKNEKGQISPCPELYLLFNALYLDKHVQTWQDSRHTKPIENKYHRIMFLFSFP